MKSVLLTAFKPYDRWSTNASWLCVEHLTRELPQDVQLTTRLYPVDFNQVRAQLAVDLSGKYDVALHLGQAPGSTRIALEAVGLNVAGNLEQRPEAFGLLEADGPVAYRTSLPLASWAARLRAAGIPTEVSYHAGTFLCNATLYWSQHLCLQQGLPTRSAFVHLPLDPSQVLDEPAPCASLPASIAASALRLILAEIAR